MYLGGISLGEFLLSLQMRPDILICRLGALQQILWLFHSSGNTDKVTLVRGWRAGTCKEISLAWKEPEDEINEQKIREVNANVVFGRVTVTGSVTGGHSPRHSCPTTLLSPGARPSLSTGQHLHWEHPDSSSSCCPNSLPGKLSCTQTSCLLLAKHFHLVELLQIWFAPAFPITVRNNPKTSHFCKFS